MLHPDDTHNVYVVQAEIAVKIPKGAPMTYVVDVAFTEDHLELDPNVEREVVSLEVNKVRDPADQLPEMKEQVEEMLGEAGFRELGIGRMPEEAREALAMALARAAGQLASGGDPNVAMRVTPEGECDCPNCRARREAAEASEPRH